MQYLVQLDIIYEYKTINHPIFEDEKYLDKQKSNNICKLFKICDEKNNICILGLEYISDQMYKIHIILEGFNAIDPEYDDQKGIKGISLKKGQKKIFNLRAIAGYDKSNFSIELMTNNNFHNFRNCFSLNFFSKILINSLRY